MKAIETTYAGCRFRSRLEARWAVFFDTIGVRWEYEPQGFHVTRRLQCREEDGGLDEFLYLPDFWLPDADMFAEVKGALTDDECERLLHAAASLSSNDGGGCGYDNGGKDLLILGPVYRSDAQRWPTRLHMHKGTVYASPWPAAGACNNGEAIADDSGLDSISLSTVAVYLLEGCQRNDTWVPYPSDCLYAEALTKARGARFEHGEAA